MDRIPSSPPLIVPLPEGTSRPLWSVMIPAYNCSNYLRQTLRSVLEQALPAGEMQIEVIDDASTDADVEQLVREIGKGRIEYFRQPENRGSLRNFETCINRARGHWIHILHGDDLVEKGFYDEIGDLFRTYPELGAAYTGFWHFNEENGVWYPNDYVQDQPGIIENWLEIIATGQKLQPPSMVVKRAVYEKLGGFFGVHYGEDWEMWVRIAAHYPVGHSPKKLAKYRIHPSNISSAYFLSGQNIRDIAWVINTIRQYLPPDREKALQKKARRNWSHYFARTSDMVYNGYKAPRQAFVQSWKAFLLDKNRVTLYYLLKNGLKGVIRYKYRRRS